MSTSVNLGKVQIAYKGEYSPTETYTILDRVSLNGTYFECKVDNTTNVTPVIDGDNNNWVQLNNIKPGKDGFNPTAVVSKVGDTATITIVDINGASTASIKDGAKGDTGEAPTIESAVDVVTLAPGSMGSASISRVGTTGNKYKLKLNIPRGDVGPAPELPNATTAGSGLVKIGANINVSEDGTISIPAATTAKAGVVKLNNTYTSTSTSEAATANMLKTAYDKAVAAATAAQNAQTTADNATTSANGKWTAVDASTTTKGIVKIGSNIAVASGVISVPVATTSKLGVVKIGSGLNIGSDGNVTVPAASTTTFGSVKIGTNITNSSGTISVPTATNSVLGVVKTGTNITNSDGTISVADGTTSAKGLVQLSSSISSTSETLAATAKAVKTAYDLAAGKWTKVVASASAEGVVKIGTNITISSGAISVANGSTSAKGVVQLSDAVNSTSTGLAATANAVKQAYDLASSANSNAVKLSGNQTIAGTKTFSNTIAGTVDKALKDGSGNTITSTYAKLASPALTGTPTAPTAAKATNNTQIATTAFVKSQGYLTAHQTLPSLSVASSGSGNAVTNITVSAHKITFTKGSTFLTSHQSLSAYAKLASPTFTGTPKAPTPAASNNSTQIATTAWVRTYAPTATTNRAGIVQLNNATNSTSTTQAATANAVRLAYNHYCSHCSYCSYCSNCQCNCFFGNDCSDD